MNKYTLRLPTEGMRTIHGSALDMNAPIFHYNLDSNDGLPEGHKAQINNKQAAIGRPGVWQFNVDMSEWHGDYNNPQQALIALEDYINRDDFIVIGDMVWADGENKNGERFRVVRRDRGVAHLKLIAHSKEDGREIELEYTREVPLSMLHKIA